MAEAAPPASSRIFISYRREDSSGHVLALLPALRRHFGAHRIFKDTDNIPPGADFVKFIRRELETCSVLLAIIGREWLTIQDPRSKQPRLQNPDDFLRVEVGTALKNERIRVIPVLVERSSMPAAEDLPQDLADLAYRNALELSDGRWDSDIQLLIQAIERATAAAEPETSVQRPELLDLQKRRAREIAAQLASAREAIAAQDYEATVWACEKALLLDPQQIEALELLDRARKAIDEQKIAAWLGEARQLLTEGDTGGASDLIDQALSLDHNSQAGLELRKEMLALRRERERERERARAVRAAIDRARSSLDDQDFDAAVRHADDALAADPHSADAQEIRTKALAALDVRRRQREHRRRAHQTVAEARAKFSDGHRAEALSLLRDFTPEHEVVTEALQELQARADAITTVHTRVDDLIARATANLEAAQIDEAIVLLSEASGLEPGRSQIATLLREAREKRASAAAAAAARDEANRILLDASARFIERDFPAAQRLVEAARSRDPQHPEVGEWLRRIEHAAETEAARARREVEIRGAIARATECLEKRQFGEALRHADAALDLDAGRDSARDLRERAAAAIAEQRAREEHDRRAREATLRARALFAGQEYRPAIQLLESFQPPHPSVSEALGDLRERWKTIEERGRQEAEAAARERAQRLEAEKARADAARAAEEKRLADERARLERERIAAVAEEKARDDRARETRERREAEDRLQAEQARRARVEALLAEAESQLAAGAYKAARRQAEGVLRLDPSHEAAQSIAAIATHKLHEASPELWWPRRVRMLATAAVLVVSASAAVVYYRQTPPPSEPGTTPLASEPAAAPAPTGAAPTQSGTVPPPKAAASAPRETSAAPEPAAADRPGVSEPAELGRSRVSKPTASEPSTAEKERAERLSSLRATAHGQLARGQRAQALTTITQGLAIDPRDANLRDLLDRVVSDAHQTAERAKSKARAANALTLAANTFTQALKLEDDAAGLRDDDKKEAAARGFWRAAERFDDAAAQATAVTQDQARLIREAEDRRQKSAAEDPKRTESSNRGAPANSATSARGANPPPRAEETNATKRTPTPADPSPPSVAPARPPNRADEESRVNAVLKRYEAAHDSSDVDTIRRLFPTVRPELVKAMRTYEYYRIDLVCGDPKLSNDLTAALVQCRSIHWFKPQGAREQDYRGQQVFTLQKRGDEWIIVQIVDNR